MYDIFGSRIHKQKLSKKTTFDLEMALFRYNKFNIEMLIVNRVH